MTRTCAALIWLALCSTLAAAEPISLRVMTFNLWHGGDAGRQPLEQTVKTILEAKADMVGLQETAGLAVQGERPDNARKIAEQLGWNYLDQGNRTGIISRFPIIASTPLKWGVQIEPRTGEFVWLFNAHFAHAPYQPYQLLNIPYASGAFIKTEAEAIQAAKTARNGQVSRMLSEVREAADGRVPVFVTGDFNEPSHLDGTAAATAAKKCPIKVEWPTTKAVVDAGFIDAFRHLHQDPITAPGLTWTPMTSPTDPKDRHDRIDFVFARGETVKIKSAEVVGEKKETADIVVNPYPSDHRAVVVAVVMEGKTEK